MLLGLNSLGNYFQSQVMRQEDNDADDLMALNVAVHRGDEASVDFQRIHGKPLQTRKRGVASAEVVDAQPNANGLQFRKQGC